MLHSQCSKSWIPRLFQRIWLVKCLAYPSRAQTTEILWKSQGIHDLEPTEGSVYASLKWVLCIDRVNIQSYVYFHCFLVLGNSIEMHWTHACWTRVFFIFALLDLLGHFWWFFKMERAPKEIKPANLGTSCTQPNAGLNGISPKGEKPKTGEPKFSFGRIHLYL